MAKKITIPPYLQPGDTIGIMAPASQVAYDDCQPGIQILREKWYLNIIEGYTLRSRYFQFSGTDQARTNDLQAMLDSPKVKAIIAARGGYGCSRILDDLDFTAFKKSPKWVAGFSDVTVLLSHLHSLGVASLHSPMVKTMTHEGGEMALDFLKSTLFGEPVTYQLPSHPLNRPGSGVGQVTGGNLCLLAHLLGSRSAVDTRGKLLFIEDINEYLYNIDRMMIQLKRAGQLATLAGLIVGQLTDSRDNDDPPFGKSAYEIIQEHTRSFSYPVCFDFPVGHVADNRPLPVGLVATLDVAEDRVSLMYHPTSA